MGANPSVTNTFVANTRAKASQVNTNFSNVITHIGSGTADLFSNSFVNNRVSSAATGTSVTIGNNKCLNVGYFTIDTNATYTLNTSTSRMVAFGELVINTGGSLITTSTAEILIL